RQRHWVRIAKAAWYLHHRWTARQPGADVVHDARDLPVLRTDRVLDDEQSRRGPFADSRAGRSGRMSVSTPFIYRPIATSLLLVAMTLAGAIAYTLLPVSALPEVDFPTITVSASLPGASPEVMAASVATPLEKQFTRIAGVTEMTSNSSVGSAQVTLQFELG